jgi:lysophospholipase L1-like esterase
MKSDFLPLISAPKTRAAFPIPRACAKLRAIAGWLLASLAGLATAADEARIANEFLEVDAAAEETDPRLHPDGQGWGFYPSPDQADLPRVLLIGDSIANGYRGTVAAELKGKAVVDAWVTGLHENSPELHELLRLALARGSYAVVHFNIGLHGWPEGRIPEGQYEPLMRKYVEILREGAPGAKLIWASSTPVTVQGKPTELNPEINPIIVARNAAAAKIMEDNKIAVNDLYQLGTANLKLASGDRFHWTQAGKTQQAKAVAAAILNALAPAAERENAPPQSQTLHASPKVKVIEAAAQRGSAHENRAGKAMRFAIAPELGDRWRTALEKHQADLWFGGHWYWDWADDFLPVASIDGDHVVTMGPSPLRHWKTHPVARVQSRRGNRPSGRIRDRNRPPPHRRAARAVPNRRPRPVVERRARFHP